MTRKNGVDLEDVEATIQALADATRLRILALLAEGEVCVCRIHESLGLPQSKVSRHLAYLRRAGLVRARKEGLWVHYSLAQRDERLDALVASVQHCLGQVRTIQRDRRKLAATTGVASSACDEIPVARCSVNEAALPKAETPPTDARTRSRSQPADHHGLRRGARVGAGRRSAGLGRGRPEGPADRRSSRHS